MTTQRSPTSIVPATSRSTFPAGAGGSVFYQPRNFAFWGYLALVGIGVLLLAPRSPREYNAYGEAIGLAVTSFAIYAALFWWFTEHIDHYAKLPAQADGRRVPVGRLRRHRGDGRQRQRRDTGVVRQDLRPGVGAELGCRAGGPVHRRNSPRVRACCCSSRWRNGRYGPRSTGSSWARSSAWAFRSSRTSPTP